MSLLTASLYLLTLAFLFGSALFVFSRDPFSRLHNSYALLAMSLLGWVGSLFVFNAQAPGTALLWWGRLNFATAAIVAPAVYVFILALAREKMPYAFWIWTETVVLALISLFTGLIDHSETVVAGGHVTIYGPLFPLYVLHILLLVGMGLRVALWPTPQLSRRARVQLTLVGIGVLSTAVVSIITNAVLPYLFGDFRFINIGTIATIGFIAAVSYAAVFERLFNIRFVVRTTVVLAMLVAFALAVYQVAVSALAGLLPVGDPQSRHMAAASVALTVNAFTYDPLRQWLDELAGRLLTGRERPHRSRY